MGTDGIPEESTKRLGEEIARLRSHKAWSRTQLVVHIVYILHEQDQTNPLWEVMSENWLARLENGRMVKVPRQVIDAICLALDCTADQRVRLLTCADRNILANKDGQTSSVAEVILRLGAHIYDNATVVAMIDALLADRHASMLEEAELHEILTEIVEILASKNRAADRRKGMGSNTSVDRAYATPFKIGRRSDMNSFIPNQRMPAMMR